MHQPLSDRFSTIWRCTPWPSRCGRKRAPSPEPPLATLRRLDSVKWCSRVEMSIIMYIDVSCVCITGIMCLKGRSGSWILTDATLWGRHRHGFRRKTSPWAPCCRGDWAAESNGQVAVAVRLVSDTPQRSLSFGETYNLQHTQTHSHTSHHRPRHSHFAPHHWHHTAEIR